MKKSETGTKHYTKDGIRYRFDHNALDEKIREQARFNSTTITHMLDRLGNALAVSPDTVKGWKDGKNAPVDLELVGRLSECLHVDSSELLLPEKEGIFVNTYRLNSDRELVRRIFQECVEIAYDYAYRNDASVIEECDRKIDYLHKMVDKEALFCTSVVRYKLQKFLIEFCQVIDYPFLLDRWIEITNKTSNKKWNPFRYPHGCLLEEEHEFFGEIIDSIDREILLAENLGFSCVVQVPESFREKARIMDENGTLPQEEKEFEAELKKCGFKPFLPSDLLDFTITPEILWTDTMVQTLRVIFLHDFADIMED